MTVEELYNVLKKAMSEGKGKETVSGDPFPYERTVDIYIVKGKQPELDPIATIDYL